MSNYSNAKHVMEKKEFGEIIKAYRKKMMLDQNEFAERLGVGVQTVSNWENGNYFPKEVDKLIEIADFFGCDLDYLTGRMKPRTHDTKTLCELSGLTVDAAEKLQKLKTWGTLHTEPLSKLIESERFSELNLSFGKFLTLCKIYKDMEIDKMASSQVTPIDGNKVVLSADEALYHFINKTSMIMNGICENELPRNIVLSTKLNKLKKKLISDD